jgi:hypothetical protein
MNHISFVAARPLRTGILALVLMAAMAVGALFVVNAQAPVSRHQPIAPPAAGLTGNPSASNPVGSATTVASAIAAPPVPASPLGPFTCASTALTAGQPPASAFVDAIRTGSHSGYDRLAIQFSNGQPNSIELRPQAGTTFTRSPRGDTVTLAGLSGIQVVIRGADGHTAYSGPTDIKTGASHLLEVRQLEDFEGQVQLGLGVSGTPCYRAFIVTNPTRLVIDVAA